MATTYERETREETRRGLGEPSWVREKRYAPSEVVPPEEKRPLEFMATGSVFGLLFGGAAIVLSILGLAGVAPFWLVSIAAMAVGVALMFQGGTVVSRLSRLLSQSSGGRIDATNLGHGLTVELIGGIVGGVLGLLSLIGLYPVDLAAIAGLVFGGAIVFGSVLTGRLNVLVAETSGEHKRVQLLAREAAWGTMGAQMLVGLSAVVLSIIALFSMEPIVLVLTTMLVLGGSAFLTDTTIPGRLFSMIWRR